MSTLKKMTIKTAVALGAWFYALSILLQALVISGIVPYPWINGGRSNSLADQLPLSVFNIAVSILGVLIILIAGGYIPFKFKKTVLFLCRFLTAYWIIGFIQQLIGTPFEKAACSLLLLLGVISHLRLAIEKQLP